MNRQKGLTLIEVLIALVVISVGLLGVAGLQLAGLRFNQVASTQSTAAVLVDNMAAAMRANYAGVVDKDYLDTGGNPSGTDAIMNGGAPATLCRAAADSCNGLKIAKADLWQWSVNVSRLLPSGKGIITCNPVLVSTGTPPTTTQVCAANSSYTIEIHWDEDTLQNGHPIQTTQTFQTVFQP